MVIQLKSDSAADVLVDKELLKVARTGVVDPSNNKLETEKIDPRIPNGIIYKDISQEQEKAFAELTETSVFGPSLSYGEHAEIYRTILESAKSADRIGQEALEAIGFFTVMTYTERPEEDNLTHTDKVRAYNGENVEGVEQETILSLASEEPGLEQGLSISYIHENLVEAIESYEGTLDTPEVLEYFEEGLNDYKGPEEEIEFYEQCLEKTREEFVDR